MGTWDSGLLDNDNALDGLGELAFTLREELSAASDPGRAAAAVGVLLQLSAWDFSKDNDAAADLQTAIAAIDSRKLAPEARALLEQLARGEGAALARRPAKLAAAEAKLLHASGKSGFGERQAALFDSKAGAAYVQELADAWLASVEADLSDEYLATDLCREASSMGALGALLVLEPVRLPKKKLEKLRALAAAGLRQLEEKKDDELDFHRKYHAAVDGVFAALLARAAAP